MPRVPYAFIAALLVMIGAGECFAQAAPDQTVELNLKPWIALGFDCLSIVALAAATALAGYIGRTFGQRWSAETRATVTNNIAGLMQAALQRAQAAVPTENMENVRVQKGILTDALKYVVDNGPQMMKRAGIDVSTPEGQRQIAEKLESLLAPAIMVAAASKDQVSVATAATVLNPAVPTAPVEVATAKLAPEPN